MKKLLLVSLCFLSLFVTQVYAQNRTITGTVTSKDDGLPLPGVSVTVPGTTIGTQTSSTGKYSLAVPATAKSLSFSFVGYERQEVAIGGNVVNAIMGLSASQLSEVVVTGAFNTKQTSRSASYAAQVVKSEALNTVRQPNVNNALAGKVAGVQVRSQSAGALGRSTDVRLRGGTGFGLSQGALYVVDGTILPNSSDINPDDIDNISVLQGPAASAQFGSAGAYGAIVITTKRGRKTKGAGIELNLGANFDNVYILPNYQNSYAGGAAADLMQYHYREGVDPVEWKALDGKYYPDYTDDSSWGPKMVGQEYIPWYAWAPGTKYSFKTANLTAQPDNARDFFRTGVSLNNSVAFTKSADDYNLRMSYNNQYTSGIIPYTDVRKNVFNLNVNYDLGKHFTTGANVNFVGQKLHGNINDGYANQSSGNFNQWMHRDLDMGIMKELQDLTSPDGTLVSWNHQNPTSYDPSNPGYFYAGNYWYNMYKINDLNTKYNQRDRLYGNIYLQYKLNNDFSVKATYRKNSRSEWQEEYIPYILQTSGSQTGVKNYYRAYTVYENRENYELLANYNKQIADFKIDANVGTDIYNRSYKDNGGNTNDGLSINDLFTLNNSVSAPTIFNTRINEQYRAIFGKASIGYKNFLFGDISLRQDYFSTLFPGDNGVLSKSFGGSFVFSELVPQFNSWLSFGKVRVSYGEIPQALATATDNYGYYRTNTTYSVGANKFGTNVIMGTPDQSVDPNLHGAVFKQTELGLDLRFLNDRLGLSATYYFGTDEGFPASVTVNPASGFSSILTNYGKIQRKGIELTLSGTPVRTSDFSWDVTINSARQLQNKIVEISDKYGVTRVSADANSNVWGTDMPYMVHEKGKQWGQLYGNGIKRNADGVPIIGANGMYVNDPNVYFGSVLPKWTGGIQNSFTVFKDFILNANIDYQVGGKFVSLSNRWGQFSGLTAATAALNDKGVPVRDPVADGGGVKVSGVNEAGEPVSNYIDAKAYFQGLTNNKTYDPYIYDLTFVKLREIAVGYKIPVAKLGLSKVIQSARFEITGRNLLLIYAKSKDYDPSEISAQQGETGQLPGTRGIGFNLRVNF
ncbi:SusC/RagA family TonB-linked outer membrane protein [Mucilaginibacter litoreus]|uniref:SusC/RagA family TonB-linked outer membrane protein n=1 Tax=Mucilaginibacter litoreus TaxID=1048221 RepID=A0ABW3AWI1_9SPHI